MLPAFQIHLNQPILERTASVGKFDGKHPSLACGTTAGKVFLHSPNEKNESDSEQNVRYLNINRKVSSLAAGKFKESEKADTLVIGTQTSLLAYNVEKNSDIFYKDVPDGVNTMLFAPVFSKTTSGTSPSQMIVVGGNCSIQGFDREGNELMWNVTGDNVRALAMCDVTGQGRDELIVGSDDFEIKAFQQEDIVFELMETSKIVALCPIQKQLFGYALINGTVGVYKGKHRVWRVKSKNTPITIQAFDINGDGEKELIIGWSNGKFEARRIANGEIVHKDKFGSSIAAIVTADYRMDGNEEVICCSTDGEIRGYFTTPGDFITSVAEEKAQQEEKEVIKLSKLKASLQQELKNIEVLTNTSSSNSNVGGTNSKAKNSALRIPFGTKIQIKPNPTTCSTSTDQLAFQLEVSTENESVIKMVVLQEFDVGIFEGESLVIRPSQPSSRVMVPLNLTKNMTAKLDMKILVGSRGNNTTFHVFEESYTIPKFAMFIQTKAPSSSSSSSHKQQQEPKGSVCFKTPLKTQQMCGWIDSAFTLNSSFPEGSTNIDLYFKSYRDGSPLQISLNSKETIIRTDDMQLAAEIVQDMCTHLEWRELESIADFPQQMEEFRHLLVRVDECNAIRLKLTGEMADDSNQVKNLVIRAEDARILNDMTRMRRYYSELFTLNNQLLGEYTKRSTNHQALLDALKEVNNMIQLAARLRFGNAKSTVVSACRKAIKNNNIHALFYIVKTGKEEHTSVKMN